MSKADQSHREGQGQVSAQAAENATTAATQTGAKQKCNVQAQEAKMSFKLRVYDFLAAPAHLWLWCCGRLMGWRFECGPVG